MVSLSFPPFGLDRLACSTLARPRVAREVAFKTMSDPAPSDPAVADGALLLRVAAADQAALGELYDRYHRPLFATAVRILRDEAEAEDVVHDVFVTVWNKAVDFDASRGTAFSWVITLLRNRAIDRVRSRRRRGELLAQAAVEDLPVASEAADLDVAENAVWHEQAGDVRRAVAQLPEEQREALTLAFFSGLTQNEISTRLNTPLGTVKARIRRGLLRLRTLVTVQP